MSRKEIDPETASQIKKELTELRAQLQNQKRIKKQIKQVLKTPKEKRSAAAKKAAQTRKRNRQAQEAIRHEEFLEGNRKYDDTLPPQLVPYNLRKDFEEVEFRLREFMIAKFGSAEEFENKIHERDANDPDNKTRWKHIQATLTKNQKYGIGDNVTFVDSMTFGLLLDFAKPILEKENKFVLSILEMLKDFRNNVLAHPNKGHNVDTPDDPINQFMSIGCVIARDQLNYKMAKMKLTTIKAQNVIKEVQFNLVRE